jgi:hypothetical protein
MLRLAMPLFNYDDRVRVSVNADVSIRPGAEAWVVGVLGERPDSPYFASFPLGVIYTIEYADGESVDVHESSLEAME